MKHPSNFVAVESTIRDALIDFAQGYRRLPRVRFERLASGIWADYSFENHSGTLSLTGSVVRLMVEVKPIAVASLYDLMKIRNQPLRLTLNDGATVTAQLANMERISEHAQIALHHWRLDTAAAPVFWIGSAKGKFPTFGNLRIAEQYADWNQSKNAGYRFDGRYTWYVLPPTDDLDRMIVVDPNGLAFDRASIWEDLRGLQYTIGGDLGIDYFVGCDAECQVVAAMAVGSIVREWARYRPPVPHGFKDSEIWLPEFFRLLSARLHQEGPEPLSIPIMAYLDAQSDHLDGAYLKAQVGLQSFARRVSSTLPPTTLATMAPVEILRARGIELPEEVTEEIRRSGTSIHDFLMNGSLDYNLDQDVRRVEMVQTVIAALVADYVGYSGPIHGYDVASDGGRLEPSWWPVRQTRDDAPSVYLVERKVDGPKPKPSPPAGDEFALLVKVSASDREHFAELKELAIGALRPNVLSMDLVDIEFAEGARDAEFMTLALEQARRSESEDGAVRPKVGAVVVDHNQVLACAFRGELASGDHAEYTALEKKLSGVDLSNAIVYTTLEPCTSRNPPKKSCAERLIERKIRRVVIGTLDPNPKIKGEGVLRLREAGISVQLTTPSVAAEIESLNAVFNQEFRSPSARLG